MATCNSGVEMREEAAVPRGFASLDMLGLHFRIG